MRTRGGSGRAAPESMASRFPRQGKATDPEGAALDGEERVERGNIGDFLSAETTTDPLAGINSLIHCQTNQKLGEKGGGGGAKRARSGRKARFADLRTFEAELHGHLVATCRDLPGCAVGRVMEWGGISGRIDMIAEDLLSSLSVHPGGWFERGRNDGPGRRASRYRGATRGRRTQR